MPQILVESEALDTLKKLCDELQADAARYRWLRDSAGGNLWYEDNWTRYDLKEEFDSAIDRAMKADKM